MKANAPEKIYLQHVEDGRLWPAWFTVKILNDDIEYIQTDAFIEKAKKWFEKQNEWFDPNGNRHCDMESFEDFRKYMEV